MKKAIIIFCCILFFSCAAHKMTLSPFIAVYKSDGFGNIYPEYILLRTQPKVFERYFPTPGGSGTVGEWNIKNDTLFLLPKREYFSRDLTLIFSEITPQDTSVATIPQQYLIRNDCLIDITDYSIILPELLNSQSNKAVYWRVNSK
jgi:hypothetical protein